MIQLSIDTLRQAVLTTLVKRAPKSPGRTALMKFTYLLQAVRGVPLGYRFRLYNYGPYDEQVLADAREATTAGLLKSQLVTYSHGYGYEFSLGDADQLEMDRTVEVLAECSDDIDWIINNFGSDSASKLELVSTLVFALCDKNRKLERSELIDKVHEIKPHFSKEAIGATADQIEGILECVPCSN